MIHSCKKFDYALANKLIIFDERMYSDYVIYDKGEYHRHYGMALIFCPYCGEKLK